VSRKKEETIMTSKLNARSANRIQFHLNRIEKRKLLLAKYAEGSKGFERTMKAMQRDFDIITEVESKLGIRLEDAARREALMAQLGPKLPGKRGRKPGSKNKGTRFEIVIGLDLESCNDNSSGALPVAS